MTPTRPSGHGLCGLGRTRTAAVPCPAHRFAPFHRPQPDSPGPGWPGPTSQADGSFSFNSLVWASPRLALAGMQVPSTSRRDGDRDHDHHGRLITYPSDAIRQSIHS